KNQYASNGTIVSATTSEASSAIATVTENGRNNSPVAPLTNATGRNTATVVSVDAVTAPATSLTESTTWSLVSRRTPKLCRLMFSITTLESSTTRPTATVSAARVNRLSEYSPIHNPIMAISSDSGIEIAVIRVDRTESRKSRITMIAKTNPSPPSTARSCSVCSIIGAWSKTVL